MNTLEPPVAAVDSTRHLLDPLPQPIPCDTAAATAIAGELGYHCPVRWIEAGQDLGFLPKCESWDYPELTVLLSSLEFRQRWLPGWHDSRKSQPRLALERSDRSLVSDELMSVFKYDSEFLLTMLLQDGLSATERDAIIETLRWRMLAATEDPA